jgi:hypothetical protein
MNITLLLCAHVHARLCHHASLSSLKFSAQTGCFVRFCRSAHVRQRSCNCESVYACIVIHAHAHPYTISLPPFLSLSHSVFARTQQSQKNTSSSAFSLIPGTCMQLAQNCPRLVLCCITRKTMHVIRRHVGTLANYASLEFEQNNHAAAQDLYRRYVKAISRKNLVWLRAS